MRVADRPNENRGKRLLEKVEGLDYMGGNARRNRDSGASAMGTKVKDQEESGKNSTPTMGDRRVG